jgi:hypothetical protein
MTASFAVTPGTTIYIDANIDCHYSGYTYGFNNNALGRLIIPKAGVTSVPNQTVLTFRA